DQLRRSGQRACGSHCHPPIVRAAGLAGDRRIAPLCRGNCRGGTQSDCGPEGSCGRMTRGMPGSAAGPTLAGVIGWPVAHSLSPRMHAFWLREHAIDGAYVALSVQRYDLSAVLEALRKAGFAGVNMTVPHKEAAFALAQTADDAARSARAANLLMIREGRLEAFNT